MSIVAGAAAERPVLNQALRAPRRWTALVVASTALISWSCERAPTHFAGAGSAQPAGADAARRVNAIAREYAAVYAEVFPDQLSSHDRLPDNSLGALGAFRAREDTWLRALAEVDLDALWGQPDWSLAGYLKSSLASSVALRACRLELWPAHQLGWQTSLLTSLDTQPLGTQQARAEALTRWQALPRYLATELQNLREGLRLGYTVPRPNAELAVVQLDALLAAPNASPLGAPLARDSDPEFQARWRGWASSK